MGADMFPCEDSKTLSVCTLRKENYPGFINISPTVTLSLNLVAIKNTGQKFLNELHFQRLR